LDSKCKCHSKVITTDLAPYKTNGIQKENIDKIAKYGVRYKIYNKVLYREKHCLFPSRCSGIEHFILKLISKLPNLDFIVNTRDYPQLPKSYQLQGPIFSFSKTVDYKDIMYPAWTFWEGGPAIALHPTGIGRWDLMREEISKSAENWPWNKKVNKGFFRGSRTSDERDSLVLLSRRLPALVDAQYTKNQAWKSPKDTLNAEPASEISLRDHCKFKYLFNFRGVAASFRFKHLFLCKSLVFHVGDEWNEFFYFAMKPWVHYVPLKSYPNEKDIEDILLFFQNHDDLAKSIAERGYEFIWNHLRINDVDCYWEKLLKRYSKLLNYTVSIEDDLFPIKRKTEL